MVPVDHARPGKRVSPNLSPRAGMLGNVTVLPCLPLPGSPEAKQKSPDLLFGGYLEPIIQAQLQAMKRHIDLNRR